MKKLIMIVLGLLMVGSLVIAQDQTWQTRPLTAQEMLQIRKQAVAFINYIVKGMVIYEGQPVGQPNGEPFFIPKGTCSSAIISPDGFVLTAGHCAQDYPEQNRSIILMTFANTYLKGDLEKQLQRQVKEEDLANLVQNLVQQGKLSIHEPSYEIQIYVRTGNAAANKADVLEVSEFMKGKDVAVLKIPGDNFPTMPLGNSKDVNEGDHIYVYGYPGIVQNLVEVGSLSEKSYLIPTQTEGIVSAIKQSPDGSKAFQLSAPTAGGSSGGPAINEKGQIIAIVSRGPAEGNKLGDPWSIFVPMEEAMVFINKAAAKPRSGNTDTEYELGMRAFWAARDLFENNQPCKAKPLYQQAIKHFDAVYKFYPAHPDAQQNSTKCQEKITEIGECKDFTLWYIIAGALLLILALIMFARGNKKPSAPAAPKPAPKPKDVPVAAKANLVIKTGELAGNSMAINPPSLKIGRDPAKNQIVLTSGTVSREHAIIEIRGDKYVIRNLSGTNPTFVNDRQITETELKSGDIIKIGGNDFQFKV